MTVSDYMTAQVFTASARDGLHQTFIRMRERNVRHMPVLGQREALVGIVSERDIRRPDGLDSPNASRYFAIDNKMKVEEVMSTSLVTVLPTDPVVRALDLLVETRFGALPVVDAQGVLVGILSAIDVLRAFQDSLRG